MKFDVIVVGGGPGGIESARILARAGKKVALLEYRDLGGTCVNRGCIPAKTMLYSAEMFRVGKKIRSYGIRFCEDVPSYDFDAMMKKREEIILRLRKDLQETCTSDGVKIINSKANLVSNTKVVLDDGSFITADFIVLASGGIAKRFAGFIEGDNRFLVSDNIFELKKFPKSMLIVGGGPVGTEFSTYFNTFGVKVTLVDMSSVLLNYYDHCLGKELKKYFKKDGITVFNKTFIESIKSDSELLEIHLNNGKVINVESVFSAIGVIPSLEYLADSGVETSKNGKILVNDDMQTNFKNVYALGDAVGKSGSAYGAEREGCYIAHHILGSGFENYDLDYVHFPDVVFTDPEVATCGYSEQDLVAEGRKFYSLKSYFTVNAKASIRGDTRGFCRIVIDSKTDVVLGVHIIGPQATELIHTVPIALDMKLTVKQWRRYVWGHPVTSEIIKETLAKQ